MSRPIGTPVYGLVIVLALSLYSWPLQAGMQLDIVAKFHNADLEFDVVTVIDPEVEASRNKVALLGIATPSRSSFSFGLKEWLSLIDLWTKAVKAQSGSWKVVGSMVETETSDVSHLTVSAGPGVKFAISSRKKGTATYVLSRDDMAGFEKALQGLHLKFPVAGNLAGNFLKKGPPRAILVSKTRAASTAYNQIPCSTEQGIFLLEQGIFWVEQGIL